MKKTQILMNKPVYLGLWILELNKTVMYEFCYDYAKPKYDGKAKLCFMDTHSFIVFIKTHDIYKELLKMLKQGLTLPIMSWTVHYQKEGKRKLSV